MAEERALIAKIRPVLDEADKRDFIAALQAAVRQGFDLPASQGPATSVAPASSAKSSVSTTSAGPESGANTAGSALPASGSAQPAPVQANPVKDGYECWNQMQQDKDVMGMAKRGMSVLLKDTGNAESDSSKAQAKGQSPSAQANSINDGYKSWNQMWQDKDVMSMAKRGMSALSKDTSSMEDGTAKSQANMMKALSSSIQTGLDKSIGMLKQGLGLLEDIYGRMKQASPLLQTISNLFDLAVTLFFMPLGNKLAEVMLPAILELVDNVVELWNAFDGMSLSEMFEYAFSYGVSLFAKYFQSLGALLSAQGGLLGTIGRLLTTVGNFLNGNLSTVLNNIFGLINTLLSHFKTIITLLVGFFATKIALDIAAMYVIAVGATGLGKLGAGIAVAGVAATIGTTYLGMGVMGFAEGGHIDHIPGSGGQLAVLAENEGETIIPDSKLDSVIGGSNSNNITYYINGYTDSELQDIIEQSVNRQISRSRIRAGL